MNFKDIIAQDQNIFINNNEFAEGHTIDNRQLSIVIDNDRLMHRSKIEYEGVIVGDILYFVTKEAFGANIKPDQVQTFDGIPCIVFDVRLDMGMYEVILKKNVSW